MTRRRVAAHACPRCRRLWALRGLRADGGAWIISCSSCGWSDIRAPRSENPTGLPPQRGAGYGEDAGRWLHGVYLYRTEEQLLRTLEDYLVAGWADGATGLVIATPQHRAGLRDRLTALGLADSLGGGRLVELDAEDTLGQFMRVGGPDPELFDRTVGSLVRDHAADGPLRGFGEMVDLLWAQGDAVGALELERLWTDLQAVVPFSLLCAYALEHVDEADRERITGAHDYVLD